MEKELLDLTLTFKFYFERKGMKNCEILAQIETAMAMINFYNEVFNAHIQLYKDEYHIDFSKEYKDATLDVAACNMYAFQTARFIIRKMTSTLLITTLQSKRILQ